MTTDSLTPDIPIANLFERWPQTIPVFLRRGMKCVGCEMAAFDTLAEAANNYALPIDSFLAELRSAITTTSHGMVEPDR
ncbi:MAG TPA: DUF1858 domain-containing protein [Anaerolineaceae bacterium]|nr:DUF1858 domain-containing protein [Anaerolineaceae bacterium]